MTINRKNYTIINETGTGLWLAPLNKRTGQPRVTGHIIVNKESGTAHYVASGRYAGTLK